jgi:putative toxin-antitoxin system antitoxin component (TIGR02293 family)
MLTAERIVETLGGRRVLKRRTEGMEALKERVREGLPYASLVAVARRWGLNQDDIVVLLSLPPRTLARRKEEQRLRADESDRLFRVSRIALLAEEVLGSREKAAGWLHRPNRALGGRTPLRQLDTDLGARQVEDILVRIAHGVYS